MLWLLNLVWFLVLMTSWTAGIGSSPEVCHLQFSSWKDLSHSLASPWILLLCAQWVMRVTKLASWTPAMLLFSWRQQHEATVEETLENWRADFVLLWGFFEPSLLVFLVYRYFLTYRCLYEDEGLTSCPKELLKVLLMFSGILTSDLMEWIKPFPIFFLLFLM